MKGTLMHYPETPSIWWPGLLLQTAYFQCCKTTKVHVMVLGCINRIAWGTKLLLMAAWGSLVNYTNSCHLLKAQDCSLSPNGCFTSPLVPHPPAPSPSHSPTPYRINPWYYRSWKNYQKTSSTQVACRDSYITTLSFIAVAMNRGIDTKS